MNFEIPDMTMEVIEALHSAYKDNLDLEIDCLRFLGGLPMDFTLINKLAIAVDKRFEDMSRCPICGEPLQFVYHKEPHPELEGCPMETMCESYCPNCDTER